MGGMM